MLDNAITPLVDMAEQGVWPNPGYQNACQEETLDARPARLATTNVIDWKLKQKEDPVLYQVVKHRKASRETFKEALLKVTDQKATTAYVKSKEQLIMKNGLLYRQSKQGPIEETVFQFVVPQIHRSAALDGCHHEAAHQGQCHSLSLMQERFWWPSMAHDLRNRMNQTIIRMIGKLEQDKKARWSEHLPEMLSAYNGTHSAVTGYSPYFLLFGRKARMPVDYLLPTLHNLPHQTKMEVSVAAMQKRLKEAFAVARHLTSQEAAKQRCYYDRKAGAVALQPGDVVMVRTDGFVGKRKVKDWWEDGGFIVESQLGDWSVYKVRCLTADTKHKPTYRILHRNRLLLVTNEDDSYPRSTSTGQGDPNYLKCHPRGFCGWKGFV